MTDVKNTVYTNAIQSIKSVILRSRYHAAALANSELLGLYFSIGGYISTNSRKNKWGTKAIESIASQLQKELPGLRGFYVVNMKMMQLFYESWASLDNSSITTDELSISIHQLQLMNLQYPNSQQITEKTCKSSITVDDLKMFLSIGFSHHCEIFTKVKDCNARLFYIKKCATEFWNIKNLKYHLKSDLYGKQGKLTSNFKKTIADADLQQRALLAFKDEYLLDFINIEDPSEEPDERVLEHGIVANVQKFIMALGKDFSFIGNQYRLEVDEKEYFIDLLFFNRHLQSLVAFELKRGEFKPEYAGKLNFYLSALDDHVKLAHENPSIGIILCKSQRKTTVEFAFRDTSKPMGVATYRLASEWPEQYRGILPDAQTLKQLL